MSTRDDLICSFSLVHAGSDVQTGDFSAIAGAKKANKFIISSSVSGFATITRALGATPVAPVTVSTTPVAQIALRISANTSSPPFQTYNDFDQISVFFSAAATLIVTVWRAHIEERMS